MKYQGLLRRSRRRVRLRRILRGVLLGFSLLAVGAALLLAVASWMQPGTALPSVLGLLFVLAGGYSLAAGGVIPLLRPISERELIDRVEHLHPELRERLSTARYLQQRQAEVEKFRFSPTLVRGTVEWAEREIGSEHFRELDDWSPVRRLAVLAVLLLAGWTALVLWHRPEVVRAGSLYRSALGYATFTASPLKIEIPGDLDVPRGQGAEVVVAISTVADAVRLHLRFEGQPWQSRAMQSAGPDGRRFRCRLPAVTSKIRYFVSTRGIASTQASIRPIDPPRIERFVYQIVPPDYTGLPPLQVEQPEGDLEAPEGSSIKLALYANNALSRAEIALAGGVVRTCRVEGSKAEIEFTLEAATAYHVNLWDAHGFDALGLGPFHLMPRADQPPQIFIHDPPLVSDLGQRPNVRVDWEAIDDYGVSKVDLVYQLNYLNVDYREAVAEAARPSASGPESAAAMVFQPTASIRRVYPWELSGLELLPGDEINFFLVAFDNDPTGGPKAATSEVHLLRLPTAMELFGEVAPQEISHMDELQQLLEQQREIQDDVTRLREKVERQGQESPAPGRREDAEAEQWQEQQQVDQLGGQQEQLGKQLEQLQAEIRDTLERLNDPGAFSLKTLEKMARIEQLFDELLTDQMKSVIQQFQKTLEEMAQDRPLEALEELEFSVEEFEEDLDRMLALLENSMLEQQIEAMTQQAQALAEEQEALRQETEDLAEAFEQDKQSPLSEEQKAELEKKREQLAQRQERLEENAEQLLENMQQMAQQQSGEKEEISQGLQEALQQAEEEQLSESLQDAVEQLQSEQMQRAAQSQSRSSQALSQLQQNLSSMMGAMGGMDFQRDMAELRRALDWALMLSERQEKVSDRLAPSGRPMARWLPELKNEVSIYERYYRDETLRIEAHLQQLASQDPFLDYRAIRELRLAARAMNRAVQFAEDFFPAQVHNQTRLGLDRINTAVLTLLESLNSLSQAQASAGLQGYFQSLQDLIRRQQQLNRQTRQQQRQRGQVPNWQQQMERLAREQAAIRRQVQELSRKFGQLEQLLGNLGETAGQMKEVEKELEDLNANEKVQEQQQQILTRLLDAEKSVQQRGFSKQRQSETARDDLEGERPGALPENLQTIRSRVQKLRQGVGEEFIPPEFRSRIRYYFQRLSEES